MKSFDEVVDGLWKPKKLLGDYDDIHELACLAGRRRWGKAQMVNHVMYEKRKYASQIMLPFYGRDVQEPVVKICKRILEKPNRFHLVKESNTFLSNLHRTFSWKVILDKDTNQKFVRDSLHRRFENPSCLSTNEQELLASVLDEWYNHQKEILAKKEATREEKRKGRFRKELSDLYEGY